MTLNHLWRRLSFRTPAAGGHRVVRRKRRFAGSRLDLLVRAGTTDEHLLDLILNPDGMYRLPNSIQPQTIFDIGGNIGIASVYFALMYPQARIYCFEPLPRNLELLRQNVACFGSRVHVMPCGLSDRQGSFDYHYSDNPLSFGGGGFCAIGHDPARSLRLPVITAAAALEQLNLKRVDVFKIDTEGSELPILQGIPAPVRQQAQAMIGELHGIGDWDVCNLLATTHSIGVQKRYDRNCFPFMAVRRDLLNTPAARAAA